MAEHAEGQEPPPHRADPAGPPDATALEARAFRRLFDAHFDELCRYVYRYVQSVEDAKDLVHDTFLRLWRQRSQVDLTGDVRSYLYAIARNQSVDQLRRRQVEARWRQRHAAPELVEHGEAVALDAEQQLASAELSAAIQRAVDALPARQRDVLRMRWQQQASYEGIAAALGISTKTVGVHMTRAIAHLRETLPGLLGLPLR
jgi:RNA polymerase sigma-70 factor (ECF subfamily)